MKSTGQYDVSAFENTSKLGTGGRRTFPSRSCVIGSPSLPGNSPPYEALVDCSLTEHPYYLRIDRRQRRVSAGARKQNPTTLYPYSSLV